MNALNFEKNKTYQKEIFGATLSFILFIFLALCVYFKASFVTHIDAFEQHALAFKATSTQIAQINFFSTVGSPIISFIIVSLIAIYFCHTKEFINAFCCEFSVVIGDILLETFKIIIGRNRPVHQLIPDTGFSFPSGHVFNTTLLVLILITLILPRLKNPTYEVLVGALLILWNGFVIFSLIFLGDHYFTDTLGAVLLAFSVWLFTLILKNKIEKTKKQSN